MHFANPRTLTPDRTVRLTPLQASVFRPGSFRAKGQFESPLKPDNRTDELTDLAPTLPVPDPVDLTAGGRDAGA